MLQQKDDELPCLLSCARVNHCYEWEECTNAEAAAKLRKSPNRAKIKSTHGREWV